MFLIQRNYPHFSFSLKKAGTITGFYCKQNEITKFTFPLLFNENDLNPHLEELPVSYEKLSMFQKKFDYVEISATDYTKSRLCVTLWDTKKNNLFYSDLNFLLITDLPLLLKQTQIELSPKQFDCLNKMFKQFSNRWKLPLYQLKI